VSQDVAIPDSTLGILSAQLRVLSLRFTAHDLARLGPRHLVYGLLVTWAVGIGRYWDHPHPYLLQSLGLGSLAVLCGLALLLYVLLLPLHPARWSLTNLVTFVSLAALPALLYAIPIERFLSLDHARAVNFWFLALVALWRVLLLGRYLGQWTDLSRSQLVAALLLPLALIIVVLTVLNLEQAVFEIMSSLHAEETAGDSAYAFLNLLSAVSILALPILATIYAFAIWNRHVQRREAAQQDDEDRLGITG